MALAVEIEDGSWRDMQEVLTRLLAGLEFGEVIELAAAGNFYLEVGRMPGEIWLLASGPPTRDLRAAKVDAKTADRLRGLGFSPPDGEKPSWWCAVDMRADSPDLDGAAAQAVGALRQVDGVSGPADLVWSHVVASAGTRALAAQLGIPRSPAQNP